MAWGEGEEKKSVQPVARGQKPSELQHEVEELGQKEQELTKKIEKEKKAPDAETLAQIARNLPRLIQKTLAKIETSQIFQTFKLPGRDYVVNDRRETRSREAEKPFDEAQGRQETEKDKSKTIAEESKMPLEELLIKKGKLASVKEGEFENFFADPTRKLKTPEQFAAAERLLRLLSHFEKALLRRFEGGEKIAQELSNGKPSFLKKTMEQWRGFFGHFIKRTVKRQISVDQINEWTYRGLVQKETRATVISDLVLATGQLEKFARFRLTETAQNLVRRLSNLEPGAKLSKQDLLEAFAEELEYLAIKSAEEEALFAQAPTKGKFLGTAQAEEKVASDLGLQLGAQLKEKEKVLRDLGRQKKGGFGWGFGEGEEPQGEGQAFVPWWQFGPLKKRRGPFRWFVVVFYLAALSLIALGILSLL